MPAPHRRNHGTQGLADKIAKVRHVESLTDKRERQVAHGQRHAKQWEEAAARLTPALRKVAEEVKGSALEQRAAQARTDHERAYHLDLYDKDVKRGKALPPSLPTVEPVVARYALDCIDCDQTMHLSSAKPRLPLCQRCRVRREGKKISARRRRAQERVEGRRVA